MQFKDYQQGVLNSLDDYLEMLIKQRSRVRGLVRLRAENPDLDVGVPEYIEAAWNELNRIGVLPRSRSGVPFSSRTDGVGTSVPNVTLKIPTGGGKTLLAAAALSRIMSKWRLSNHGVALWIVPNEAIYSQTLKALSDRQHPYRQLLDRAAAGRVKILEKTTRLDRRDVDSHLCIILLMLQSANRQTKESLKIFKDRGNIQGFFPVSDDFQAHAEMLKATPNLEVYGDKGSYGCIIRDSLGNALRVTRPVVVMDEGHRGYSDLAIDTIYGFNPYFVLELSATPKDRVRNVPPIYSNWLVDVRGSALDHEEMIKLPINITVRGNGDWRDCLRASLEHLNHLQQKADSLRSESSRYIRPICLVQVERTGSDQRDAGFIHADDAREYLLTLGVSEDQIAVKTSHKNDLKEPENQNLLDPKNQVRFIITKQALQEGWDCAFAYILCSLALARNRNAMAQLIGRILRQPDARKTGVSELDQCYVFCSHSRTRDVVATIKDGLERDGMADLVDRIEGEDDMHGAGENPRPLKRRERFQGLRIYLPIVNWVADVDVRPLDYERDILYRIDWNLVNVGDIADQIPKRISAHGIETVQVGLESTLDGRDSVSSRKLDFVAVPKSFDPLYVTRAICDIVPNAWIARKYVSEIIDELAQRGIEGDYLGGVSHLVLESLRACLHAERDRLAEDLFRRDVQAGRIQFRLRTDSHNWIMPDEMTTLRPFDSKRLRRSDGTVVEKGLFEAVYAEDFNQYERCVAGYLDGDAALQWWHRNVARRQYSMQGWKRNRVFPEFIFALSGDGKKERLMILEAKGDHLDNPDSQYKQRLMEICSEIFQVEKVVQCGELDLVFDDNRTVSCALIFESQWESSLAKLLEDGS